VVDVGCGGGFVLENIAQAHLNLHLKSLTGFDISANSLLQARTHAADQSNLTPLPVYQQASVYDLPVANQSVDVVIISDVLEHLQEVPRALQEIKRVLRPNGVVVFDTIARSWWSFLSTYLIAQEVLGIVEAGAHDWSMFINPSEIDAMLCEAGFETTPSAWRGIGATFSCK
jgi:2-polyprenyl-6-hydroxyphenyl methylase/3-demethylubiquinone-9 3-methyltransferase